MKKFISMLLCSSLLLTALPFGEVYAQTESKNSATVTSDQNVPPTIKIMQHSRPSADCINIRLESDQEGTFYYKALTAQYSWTPSKTEHLDKEGPTIKKGEQLITLKGDNIQKNTTILYFAVKNNKGQFSKLDSVSIEAYKNDKPNVSETSVRRIDGTLAEIKFTSNQRGRYSYEVQNREDPKPEYNPKGFFTFFNEVNKPVNIKLPVDAQEKTIYVWIENENRTAYVELKFDIDAYGDIKNKEKPMLFPGRVHQAIKIEEDEKYKVTKVTFTSNQAGTYYYALGDSEQAPPKVDTARREYELKATENEISIYDYLDNNIKERKIRIIAKSNDGVLSDPLDMTIPVWDDTRKEKENPDKKQKESPQKEEKFTSRRSGGSNASGSFSIPTSFGKLIEKPQAKGIATFTDVTNHWAYNDIVYAYNHGLMKGTGETTFSPETATTRGMIFTILWRLEKSPQVDVAYTFSDVPVDAYYAKAIAWATQKGLVKGYENETVGPDQVITREQLAVVLQRYSDYKNMGRIKSDKTLMNFHDMDQVSAYAKNAMIWAYTQGLISGIDQHLAPQGQASRAQVAAILHRYLETATK